MKGINKANILKKTLPVILSAIMILVLIPATAAHADDSQAVTAGRFSEDEFYSVLNEATGIAGAFNGSSRIFHDYDENDTRTVKSNGPEREYARLKGDVDTMQKLKEKLAEYFSQSIADYYMSVNERVGCVAEFDGKLYYLKGYAAQRMNDELDRTNSTVEMIGSDSGRIRFRLTVPGEMDEVRSYVYELERRGDSFVFIDYVLPSEIGHNKVPGTGNPETSDDPSIAISTLANPVTAIEDSEAEDLFSRAETMATWFTLFMPIGNGDTLKLEFGEKEIYLKDGNIEVADDGNSLPYKLVENYKNLGELKSDLETVFSHDLTERLLSARYHDRDNEYEYTHFVEYDGSLYFKAWAYASNYETRPEMRFERITDDGEKTVFRASYTDVRGDSQVYYYVLGTEDGRRVFTSFELPQYLYYKDVLPDEIASPMTADARIIAVCALALSAAAAAVLIKKKKV